MTDIRNVEPTEAQTLLEAGWIYLDVRSEPEFEAGHVPGSLNIPLSLAGDFGLEPNEAFLDVIQALYPKDALLLLGCRSGARSRRAADMLVALGYTTLADLVTGWEGRRDAFGRAQPGWSRSGLPVEAGQPEGQSWESIAAKATAAGVTLPERP